RMQRAPVHEEGIRKFTPLPDGTTSLDSPDMPRPLEQRSARHPKHAASIKRKSHRRCRDFRERGRRPCRRIVAIDALVRVDGNEHRTLSVNREVLQERGRPPRRHCSSCDRSKSSPIVFRIIIFRRCDHLISSLLSPHLQLSAAACRNSRLQTGATGATWALSLSGGSLPVIRRRKDILHKFFKRSRCAVLRRTRLLRNEDSCINCLIHLDVQRGSLRRNTNLRQHLLHLVIRKLLV